MRQKSRQRLTQKDLDDFNALTDEALFEYARCRCQKCDVEYMVHTSHFIFRCHHCKSVWSVAAVLELGEYELN